MIRESAYQAVRGPSRPAAPHRHIVLCHSYILRLCALVPSAHRRGSQRRGGQSVAAQSARRAPAGDRDSRASVLQPGSLFGSLFEVVEVTRRITGASRSCRASPSHPRIPTTAENAPHKLCTAVPGRRDRKNGGRYVRSTCRTGRSNCCGSPVRAARAGVLGLRALRGSLGGASAPPASLRRRPRGRGDHLGWEVDDPGDGPQLRSYN